MKSIALTDTIKDKTFTWYNNGIDSILREFEGFEYANTNNSFQDLPSPLGAFYSASKFSTRRLSFQGDLVGANIFANRRLMLAPMSQDGLKLLTFTTYDDLDLQCEVIVDKVVLPYTNSIHTFLVELIAPDWRFYSQTLSSSTILKGETIDVINSGTEDTFPIFTITGQGGTVFTLTNNTNGQSFTLSKEILSSNVVVIDTKLATITYQDGTNYYQYFLGDMVMLDSGTNSITFSVTGGLSTANVKVEYRNAYRGV